jgi:hypothetical protein
MALLAASRKSGELRVVGGHVEGRLWLQDGHLVASKVGRTHDHVDAMFELLRLTEGNFVFRDGVQPAEPGAPTTVEPTVKEAQARLEEWKDITEVVPSPEHRVRLIADLPTPEVTLSAEDWRMVMAVALAGSVQGVLEELHAGEFDGFRGIRRMVDAGLVLIDPPRVRPTGPRTARRPGTADVGPEPVAELAHPSLVAEPDVPVIWYHDEVEQEEEELPAALAIDNAPHQYDFHGHTEEAQEPAESEAGAPNEPVTSDSINRGLLLKFLSSVRS